MASYDVQYIVKQVLLVPLGLAHVAFNLVVILADLGRRYARYWLSIMFALPLVILSSGTASSIWFLAYLANHRWVRSLLTCGLGMYSRSVLQVPYSHYMCELANKAIVHVFLFGHGSFLKLLFLGLGLYAFGPVPAPALAFVAQDMECMPGTHFYLYTFLHSHPLATTQWVKEEVWDAAPDIGPMLLDWMKLGFLCMAYRQVRSSPSVPRVFTNIW
jgi:hypothetical protein